VGKGLYSKIYASTSEMWGGGKYQPMSLKVNNLKRKYDTKKNAKEKDG
jgi:hypothetical protein